METLQFILMNIILPLAVTFLGSYAYPRIVSYLKNRSLSSRQRKIEALKRDYRTKKLLNEHPSLLTPFAIRDFVSNLMGFIMALSISISIYLLFTYFLFTSPIGRLVYGIAFLISNGYTAYRSFSETIDLINDSLGFASYKVEAEQKIKKLGGNPEDLDKE